MTAEYTFPEAQNIVVSGDIHGDFNTLVHKCCVRYGMTGTLIIVAGDCGFGFNRPDFYENVYTKNRERLAKSNNWIVMVRGNHDNPAYFVSGQITHNRFMTVPDYSIIRACGHTILCVGGAVSIDRSYRISNPNYHHITPNPFARNLYWADENGALPDYTCLAPFFVTSRRFSFRMYANTVIPSDATRLLAYGKNSLGTSADYCEVVLPADCQYKFGGKLITEFQVVSDVHIAVADTHLASADAKQLHDAHFLAMCNDIVSNSPQSSGVLVVGDIANSGRDYEWRHANELIASVARLPRFYFSLGNHDLYGSESYFTLAQNFMTYAQTDSVYYERVIDGYYHLFLGSESKSNGLDADLSQNQLSWFDNRMQELTASRPNKPVFVYLHQSLYDTIAGSFEGQGWDGIIQNEQFRSIVAKYPQIYMFNGHSHWDMNTRGSMHDKSDGLPNIFNTASVAYLWSSYYIPTGEYLRGSQGYYVRVYENKVLVLGRDFENAKWIPSACFEAVV